MPARPGKHLGPRTARPVAPENKNATGGSVPPVAPPRELGVFFPYTPPRPAGGPLSSRPRISRRGAEAWRIDVAITGVTSTCQAEPRTAGRSAVDADRR